MRALTPFRFLAFDLDAAREVSAEAPRSLAVGLLFVGSAALAREYDGEYLPAQPQHLLVPFWASLAAALVTFLACWIALARRTRQRPALLLTLTRWVALFWWTAPLAWLYAVPWERVMTASDAAVANLLTLGLVAAWRVALMARAGGALLGAPTSSVALLLLGVSAPVVLVGLHQTALPLLAIMGGVRVPESQRAVAELSKNLFCVGLFVGPLLSIAALKHAFTDDGPWSPPCLEPPAERGRGAWLVAAAALAVGGGLLFTGQPSLGRVHEVERAYAEGRWDDALKLLASSERGDFPPHWAPPPASARTPEALRELVDAVEHAQRTRFTPRWVRAAYARTLCDVDFGPFGPLARLERADSTAARALGLRLLRVLGSFRPDELPPPGVSRGVLEQWLAEGARPLIGGGDVGALTSARGVFGVRDQGGR